MWLSLVLLCCVAAATATAAADEAFKDCEWLEGDDAHDDGDVEDPALSCRVRTIGGAQVSLGNLSVAQVERVKALRLECSDVLFFESSLETGGFLWQLRRLRDLRIEHCKIRNVPASALSALRELRQLSLRTHNTEWSAMTMDFHPHSFRGLAELRSLDLVDNNIWTFPREVFCPLHSLSKLNVSRNRLKDVVELGFSDWGGGPSAPGKSCNAGLEILDLSRNDLSVVPDNGLSGLRSLRELYLRENEIGSLEDRAFVGLAALRVLDVSGNRLDTLPPELFQSTRHLQQIYLQNNSIGVLAPGLLEGLDQLLVLDLSRNQLTSSWVNRDTFSGLVRLVVLNLAYNNIARLDALVFHDLYSLQILNLERNGIEVIAEGAFNTLSNLHALTLSHNKLFEIEAYHLRGLYVLDQLFLSKNRIQKVHSRAFENCTNLQDLTLSGNELTDVPESVKKLRFLKSLDLGENRISELKNSSFEGLEQLYGLRLIDNALERIPRNAFSNMPSLEVLNVACNRIAVIDDGAFDNVPTLRALRLDGNRIVDIGTIVRKLTGLVWLNVSDNNIRHFDYSFLPRSVEWLDMHKNLVDELRNPDGARVKMLDVSFNRLLKVGEESFPDSVESVFLNDNLIALVSPNAFSHKANLTRVVLYANKIRSLDPAALSVQLSPRDVEPPQFYVGGNPFLCDCSLEWLQRVNQLGHVRVPDLDAVTCTPAHARGGGERPLLELDPSQFLCPYEAHCFALCHCCDFDACDCEMTCPDNCTCYHDHTWSANVVDCSNGGHKTVPSRIPMDATEIYLDGNDLGELGSHVFIGKKKLRALYLNNSNIDAIHNRSFNGATSLRVLHLENNKLRELRGYEFEQLENLKELYLERNGLSRVGDATFSAMGVLDVLRLDANQLADLTPLRRIATSASRVSLEENAWSCDCGVAKLPASWAQGLMCRDADGERRDLVQVSRLCREREDRASAATSASGPRGQGVAYVPFLAAAAAALAAILVVIAVVYAFRHDVRLWAHSRYGIRLFRVASAPGAEVHAERDRLYDAYVVYSLEDEDFVSRVLAAELEQGGYALCLHHRDIHLDAASTYLADSVLSAAEASRRLLVVLSGSFLRVEWARPEFRAALGAALSRGRLRGVVLTTCDVGDARSDADLRRLLRSCSLVEWGRRRCWDKLRYAMPDVRKRGEAPPPRKPPPRYTATPTPTQSTYVSENSSQRTTDHEDDDEYAAFQHRHVYSTIPDTRPRTYFV